jgi:hypothetical protein
MKGIGLDAGPVISLSINNMLWVFEELKKRSNTSFYITEAVKREIFDRPISIKRFEIKAIQALDLISEEVLEIMDVEKEFVDETLKLANECFYANGKQIQVAHKGEIECLCGVIQHDLQAFVIDETNMRLMIEAPGRLKHKLSSRLHTNVKEDAKKVKKFQNITKPVKILRSAELLAIAYEKGAMKRYNDKNQKEYMPEIEDKIIDGMLWGTKLAGCSINHQEIQDIKDYLLKKKGKQ